MKDTHREIIIKLNGLYLTYDDLHSIGYFPRMFTVDYNMLNQNIRRHLQVETLSII